MICNINRSVSVGIITTIVMIIIIFLWLGSNKVRELSSKQIILFVAVLFIISTSMDVFNSCYTVCNSMESSFRYSVFTVALIYVFYSLFVTPIKFNMSNTSLIIINVILLGLLHNASCKLVVE